MEIFTLLETLEEILEQSKKIPFTDKAVLDKEAILEIIKEIRLKLPDELKQAKWVKALDKEIEPIFSTERKGDIKHSNADISKAKLLLGYEPEYDFVRGLNEAIEWYKNNL